MPDVSTINVLVTRSGTGFTIDVTPCNLDPDLTVKDFIVIQAGVLQSGANYQKTSRTIITYTGSSLGSTNIEVRRRTPVNVIQTVTYASRFNSALWNSELERNARWKAETELNGSGVSGVGIPIPNNGVYDSSWGSDIVYPPTRQAVYNKIQTLAPLSGAAFTTTPTVPNIAAVESTGNVPNTKYVSDNYAPLASPNLTGSPTAPTRAFGDSSVGLATTAYVQTNTTPFRVSGSVAARAAVAVTPGITSVSQLNVTLPRANPVMLKIYTSSTGGWGGGSSAATLVASWVYRIGATTIGETVATNGQAGAALFSPNLEYYVLPHALTTTTFTVEIFTRYNTATNLTWTAFTWYVEFCWQ